ncbi:uncharacterized protein KD926_005913 [Aspergillus affinis]|uniref:uncharacterized protein n=1 Tax=Aspergillus affinis TaxID=1070780 RepID=UPI0022FF1A8A|nr:uncharacterized protein KD926_005913 [Aspergillus affinis]KAI9045969.1 hypothetical protein KD926_005913 [Aspergillus affinis]
MDSKPTKPRFADWLRRSSSQASSEPVNAEQQIMEFLGAGSRNEISTECYEQPPAYGRSEIATLHQADSIHMRQRHDGPKTVYKALPPPLRSASQPPMIPSPSSVTHHPPWNEPRPGTTSPFGHRQRELSGNNVANSTRLHERLGNLFQPYVETIKPVQEITIDEWLRAAIWWALRGKVVLTRAQTSSDSNFIPDEEDEISSMAMAQGLMDLGKAWWICHQVIAQDDFRIITADPRIKTTPRGDLLDQYRCVLKYLRPYERQLETTFLGRTDLGRMMDFEKSLWVFYAPVTSYDAAILNDQRLAAWSIPLAFGDTEDLFHYTSEFVKVTLFAQEEYSLAHSFYCMFSIIRTRSNWQTLGVIASQTDLVHITIHSNGKQGPIWKEIEWDVGRLSMLVKLRHGLFLDVKFSEDSFKQFWEAAHHTVLAEIDMVAGQDEEILFDDAIKTCHYINHDKPIEFPAKPVKECRMRLFKRTATVYSGPNNRRSHRGYRLFISTPPHMKAMHQISHNLGNESPIVYSLLDADDGSPGLFLQIVEDGQRRSVFLYYHHAESRTLMHSLLVDLVPGPGETALRTFPVSSYVILERQTRESGAQGARHLEFGESLASVIEQAQEPEFISNPYGKTTLSENLRVIIESDWGSITDRINIGPGELTIGLSVLDDTVLHLHRHSQEDLTITVAQGLASNGLQNKVIDVLQALQTEPTIRRIKFETEKDLHHFQEAITGFKVIFDTVATRFFITRRRKLLSTLKHWDANITRIQVVQRGTKTQVVAFFHQFKLWKCINFAVKNMDEFERVDQKGEWGVRIKEAKYAPPAADSGVSWYGFVCLEEMEYPTEHDDMIVMFGQPTVRERFVACLPGSVGDAPKGLLCW